MFRLTIINDEQCKKRKKSCSKTLPSCSRCSRYVLPESKQKRDEWRLMNDRFMIRCTYSHAIEPPTTGVVDPSLLNFRTLPSNPLSLPSVDEQVSTQAVRLLDCISRKSRPIDVFVSTYFATFHRSLPILNQETFRAQMRILAPSSHFSTLLLSIILISHLSLKITFGNEGKSKEELYSTLKSIHGLLLGNGKVSMELVQAGVIIAAYEHCQALHRDAWVGIGNCARLGQVLGLHRAVRPGPQEEEGAMWEERKCLWWGIVVLERYVFLR